MKTTDSKTTSGFPGLIHVPFLSDLFANNAVTTNQTEIVMLLTPAQDETLTIAATRSAIDKINADPDRLR